VDPIGHKWDSGVVVRQPDCTNEGARLFTCQNDPSHTKTESIPVSPNAHKWDNGKVTTAPNCTKAGVTTYTCTINSAHTKTESIPTVASAHVYPASWDNVVQPTCTQPGYREKHCTLNSSHPVIREEIPATGHSFGPWTRTKEPTCTQPGTEERVCTKCDFKETRTVPATGHNWGPWTTTKPATCTQPGTQERTCSKCGEKETRSIPATGHNWGPWTITIQPTLTSEGERTRTCTICGEKQTERMAPLTITATLCAFGPRLRDSNLYPNNTDLWYMYTPFDATVTGTQTYELVAANMLIVGNVTITIRDGYMTIDYKLRGNDSIKVNLEFFTVLNRIADLSRYEPEDLLYLKMNRNQPINLAETFGDDTKLVLYFCSRCTLENHPSFTSLNYNSNAHQRLLSSMMALMD
jgi:hypothetical protein